MSKQRRIDAYVTSWRNVAVDMTLFKGCMPARYLSKRAEMLTGYHFVYV